MATLANKVGDDPVLFSLLQIFDGERGLMADRHHQLEMLFRESIDWLGEQDFIGRRVGVDVNNADDAISALHRDANGLANAKADNTLPGVEAFVIGRVADQHP